MKQTYKKPLVEANMIDTALFLCSSLEPQVQSGEEITSTEQVLSKDADFGLWDDEE